MSFSTDAYVATEPACPIRLQRVHYNAPAPDELVIDLSAFSVCATDLKAAKGQFHMVPPMILGHEAGGTVRAVGSAVTSLAPGDRVVLSYSSCKQCRACSAGANAYCEHIRALNFSGRRRDGSCVATAEDGTELRALFFGQSSMARTFVAHESSAVKVHATDDELRLFSALGCGIQTGAGAVLNVLRPPPGSTIAVLGAGAVGLSACLAASLVAPLKLVVVDNSAEKLANVPSCVAAEKLDTSHLRIDEVAQAMRDVTANSEGFDYVLDAVGGSGALIGQAHRALRARGTLLTIGGDSPAAPAYPQFSLSEHLGKGITYRGTHQGDAVPAEFIPKLVDFWRKGKFPFDQLITMYKFEDLDTALADLKAGKVFKAVLVA